MSPLDAVRMEYTYYRDLLLEVHLGELSCIKESNDKRTSLFDFEADSELTTMISAQ